ncbi:hypothetical protein SAMD00023353_1001180 [Rosellinia necatrix]|uniref:Uncharacterized protein n=1 Tax=Rosellinia necatrix TaxID=77044 RepID=A0A1S8A6A0_ROSNE|nr:hypothetical protein SAMD00023353_1001180 [Rosellinia necatrix]
MRDLGYINLVLAHQQQHQQPTVTTTTTTTNTPTALFWSKGSSNSGKCFPIIVLIKREGGADYVSTDGG